MKNKKIIILALLTTILATSCGGNNNTIPTFRNLDALYNSQVDIYNFDLNTATLINMLKSKQSFCLYFYSRSCSSCLSTKDFFEKYTKSKGLQTFSYEPERDHYLELVDYMPEVFQNRYVTPRVIFFKNGVLSTEMNPGKFNSYSLFSHTMNAFVSPTGASLFTTETAFNGFINDNSTYMVYSYNSNDIESSNFYIENLYPKISEKRNKNVLIIDTNFVDIKLQNTIKGHYNLSEIDNVSFIVESNNKKETVNYVNNLDKFLEIRDNYF